MDSDGAMALGSARNSGKKHETDWIRGTRRTSICGGYGPTFRTAPYLCEPEPRWHRVLLDRKWEWNGASHLCSRITRGAWPSWEPALPARARQILGNLRGGLFRGARSPGAEKGIRREIRRGVAISSWTGRTHLHSYAGRAYAASSRTFSLTCRRVSKTI